MTRVDADPRDDEAAAKRRDLDRLTELIVPHLPDHATTVADLAEVFTVSRATVYRTLQRNQPAQPR